MPFVMAVLKRDHPKELQKTQAATGVQPHMMKLHFSTSAKVIRQSWLLAAGIIAGMQLSAECKPESLQPVLSKAELSPHPAGHVFMGVLPAEFQLLPPRLYQENPFFPCNWLFCSSYAGNTCTRRNSQDHKEISN